MKQLITLVSIPVLIGWFGCNKKENVEGPDSTSEKFIPQTEMRTFLIQEIGFSSATIAETKDGFIVGGDIYFSKHDFWQRYQRPEVVGGKHYRSAYKTTVANISVDLSSTGLPAAWKTAFQSAIQKWNGLNRSVKFTEVSGYCPANGITVIYASLGNGTENTVAQGGFPASNGYPYNRVTVNSYCTGTLTAAEKLKTAVHELGHCIGFMHTDDPTGNAQISTATSSCNTGTDINSVFRQGKMVFVDFSTCDKAAVKTMYP